MTKETKKVLIVVGVVVLLAGLSYGAYLLSEHSKSKSDDPQKNSRKLLINRTK